jgi:F0F1-type ATP synthase assembly protein I
MGEEDTSGGLRGRDLVGLGGILVAGVVGGLVIGLLVDRAAGTSPLWTLVGIALGILLGIAAFVRRVRDALRD